MDSIPSYAEWKELPPNMRKEALINLRRHFNDKDIRELWEMPHKEWYRILTMFQLDVNGADAHAHGDGDAETEPTNDSAPAAAAEDQKKVCSVPGCSGKHAAKGFCLKHYNAERNRSQQSSVAKQKRTKRSPKKKGDSTAHTFDGEATSIMQEAMEHFTELTPAAKREPIDLPFPSLKGSTVQLRKQFEAVMMFLEARENASPNCEIRLSVTLEERNDQSQS